jgi:hypothetical protein
VKKYNLKDVQIFSVGEWNGDKFTEEDLQGMVQAFEETKRGVQPFIKLGHNKEQKLAQEKIAKDGLPSLGWADKMYVKGGKLFADFTDIPKKVYDLIVAKAYKKVSVEMFFNVKLNEKKYSHLITAVSLLGADTPAVMNLDDIHALYFGTEEKPKVIDQEFELSFTTEVETIKEQEMPKSELELKLEQDLDAQKKEFKAKEDELKRLADEKAAQDKEIEQLKQFKANQEKKDLEAQIELAKEKVRTFVTELVSEKLCTASMKPLIEGLLSDEKQFSVKVGDKEFKTRAEALKETLKLFSAAKEVNFEEQTKDDEEVKKFAADKEKKQEAKINELMQKNPKMTYKQAYIQAKKEQ